MTQTLGPPAHEPAVEFLESINHTQNIETCDQLEDELLAMLQKRRQILHSALEALHQYRNITAQVPLTLNTLTARHFFTSLSLFVTLSFDHSVSSPMYAVQFHADYLRQSRSFLWENCLDPLLEAPITRVRLDLHYGGMCAYFSH